MGCSPGLCWFTRGYPNFAGLYASYFLGHLGPNCPLPMMLLGLHEDEHHKHRLLQRGEERIYQLKMAWRNQLNPRIRTFCSMVPMLSYVFVQCVCLHRHEEINCNICKSISRWLPLNTAHGNILPEICFFLGRELYHQASWQCLYICIHIHLRRCVYIYMHIWTTYDICSYIYTHIPGVSHYSASFGLTIMQLDKH